MNKDKQIIYKDIQILILIVTTMIYTVDHTVAFLFNCGMLIMHLLTIFWDIKTIFKRDENKTDIQVIITNRR